jgi:hypothetical protein
MDPVKAEGLFHERRPEGPSRSTNSLPDNQNVYARKIRCHTRWLCLGFGLFFAWRLLLLADTERVL